MYTRQLDMKADKQELYHLKQEILSKADKADIDMYVLAVQNQKMEFE